MAIFSNGYREYSKSVDYSNIKNLEDLKRTQLELKYKLEQKEMEINAEFSSLKTYLNPITYLNIATQKFETLEQIISYCVKGYHSAKNFFQKHKHPQNEINNTPDSDKNTPDSNIE
jgi:hypothetical protein